MDLFNLEEACINMLKVKFNRISVLEQKLSPFSPDKLTITKNTM